MIKKLLALLLALCLMTGGFTLVALAADGDSDLVLIFEENFEEYQKDVNVSSTLMPNFFVCDANSIGDGIIHVQEATDGNLYLKSHVFTQIYSATPIVGAYELSLDIFVAQGTKQTGVFIRAPKTNAAYYEADQYPETSVCQAGLFLYTRGDKLGVNVKTYDATADKNAFLQNNTVEFPLPAGTAHPYTLRVVDANNEIQIYVNGTLMCRVTYADPGKTYAKHESTGKFYGSAKLFDAQGNEKGSYTDPLLSSDGSYVGWTTRVADMVVDNISVKAEAAYQALLAINKLPSKVTEKNIEDVKELAATARELYDALPEDKKALVINFGKLTKAEDAIVEVEASLTEAPTEAPTEPVTEVPTDAPTEAPTDAPTEPVTEAPTEEPASESQTGDEPEVRIIDDSLFIWILIAVMIVAVLGAAAYITVETRK
ncbi:MAG: PT domain-containing protein [Clostridia bacterium]|nr:PT domain-containing protein [Clostridia bacterium]